MKTETLNELELAIKKLNVLKALVKELDQLILNDLTENKSALNPSNNEN